MIRGEALVEEVEVRQEVDVETRVVDAEEAVEVEVDLRDAEAPVVEIAEALLPEEEEDAVVRRRDRRLMIDLRNKTVEGIVDHQDKDRHLLRTWVITGLSLLGCQICQITGTLRRHKFLNYLLMVISHKRLHGMRRQCQLLLIALPHLLIATCLNRRLVSCLRQGISQPISSHLHSNTHNIPCELRRG